MANTGKEPLGSMGNDAPMPALSSRSRMLFDYFTQKFAQVTNPPLDWEREEIVTSLESAIGPEPNLLADSELHAKKILIPLPVVNSDEMAQLKRPRQGPHPRRLLPSVRGQGPVPGRRRRQSPPGAS